MSTDAARSDAAGGPEVPFEEPWEARAFAMAVVTAERLGIPWDDFRSRLKSAIAGRPAQPYYESWLDALEDLALAARRR